MFASNPAAAQLLKDATRFKEKGDLEAAIEALKQAEVAIAAGEVDYGIETFLRLPMYLQAAGRGDEAIQRMNQLLEKYPEPWGKKPRFDKYGRYLFQADIARGSIYDKMRLVYKRDKNSTEALIYGFLASIYPARTELRVLAALEKKWAGKPNPKEPDPKMRRDRKTREAFNKAGWECKQWDDFQRMSDEKQRWSSTEFSSVTKLQEYAIKLIFDFKRTDATVIKEIRALISEN